MKFLFSRRALAGLCAAVLLSTPLLAQADTYDEAKNLYNLKLYSLAATSLREFLKEKPNDPNAKIAAYQLGAALYRAPDEKGNIDYKAVAAAYETAIARYPDAKLATTAQIELGDSHFQLKQYAKSLASYNAVLKSAPAAAQAAEANYWIGENHAALKHSDLARAAYQKVLASYPKSDIAPFAQFGLGLLASDTNNWAAAATAFKATAEKYPQSEVAAESRLRLGDALLAQKKYSEARAAYQATLDDERAKDWKSDALQGIADAHFGAKNWSDAAQKYALLLTESKPDDARRPFLQLRLADSFYNAKDWQKAVDAYDALIEKTGAQTPAALYYSAGALRELKNLGDAAARYRRVAEEFPKNALAPKAALHLGDVLAENKDTKGAATAYKMVLTRWATSPSATEAQDALIDLAGEVGTQNTPGDSGVEDVLRSLPAGPASSNAQLRLAQAAYAKSDWKRAGQLAQAALASKPEAKTAESASYLLASAKLKDDDAPGAATAFRAQLQKYPAGALAGEARLGLAWSLLDAKKWSDAQTAARAALAPANRLKPDLKAQLQIALGEALWRGGKAKDALPILALVETNASPDLASQAIYDSAQALESLKQWSVAAAKWEKYARISTDNAEKARGYLQQGLALAKAKNAPSALSAFDRAIAADPKGALAARALYESAWAATDAKQNAQAATRWQKLAADYPESSYAAEAGFQQGEALFAAKKWSDAAIAYRAVTENYATSESAPLAWYQLGAALYNAESFTDAATAFDRAATLKSSVAVESLFWSGESLRRAENAGESRARYEKFIASKAADAKLIPAARLGLGQSYAAEKDWTRAISSYEAAAKTATGSVAAETQFRWGEALVAAGRDKEAAPHFLKVVTNNDASAEWTARAQWNAALAFEKSGDKTSALQLLRDLAASKPASDLTAQAATKVKEMGG